MRISDWSSDVCSSDLLILGLRLDLRKLGHAVDQPPDVGAEQSLDFLGRRQRILERVVEQRGDDRLAVEAEIGQNARDLDRMAEIGVARRAFLAAVFLEIGRASCRERVCQYV